MKRDFEKENNAINEAYKALAKAQSALDHVFAVFDMQTGAFADADHAMGNVKLQLHDMHENNERIEKCLAVFEANKTELYKKYQISEHAAIMFEMNKKSIYAKIAVNDEDYSFASQQNADDSLEPALRMHHCILQIASDEY